MVGMDALLAFVLPILLPVLVVATRGSDEEEEAVASCALFMIDEMVCEEDDIGEGELIGTRMLAVVVLALLVVDGEADEVVDDGVVPVASGLPAFRAVTVIGVIVLFAICCCCCCCCGCGCCCGCC